MTAVMVPACPRWYALTRRICTTAVNLMQALHSGIWIGVLRDETFQAFDVHPHQRAATNNEVAHALSGLQRWEQSSFTDHFQNSKSMLLIAGDGGREIISFTRAGMDVEAVDYVADVTETTNRILRDEGYSERVVLECRYEIPSSPKQYDSVWIGRQCLSTIHGRSRRIAFLQQLRERSTDHATLLVSFYIRPGNGLDWRLNQWLGNMGRFLTHNPNERVELGDHLDPDLPLYHHHYLEADLRDELRLAGWQLTHYATEWFGYAIAEPLAARICDDASQTQLQRV